MIEAKIVTLSEVVLKVCRGSAEEHYILNKKRKKM
jgi:hypothetical protein